MLKHAGHHPLKALVVNVKPIEITVETHARLASLSIDKLLDHIKCLDIAIETSYDIERLSLDQRR